MPAYEDPAYFVLKEHMLPANLDPIDNKLDDPMERARLARVFDRGLDVASGYALPIQRWNARGGRPLAQRALADAARPAVPDPGQLAGRLPPAAGGAALGAGRGLPACGLAGPVRRPCGPAAHRRRSISRGCSRRRQPAIPRQPHRCAGAVRTALAVEPRDGRLCIFMPPMESAEEYAELVEAIEDTAAALELPVHARGLCRRPRIRGSNVIKVTPDPGVIEVNIQPSHSWDEQVAITEAVYEEARQARLDTCKFMLDGRQVGTGGGNHVVVGGATPADSPFLRRPDLLASLVTYWQNHPSL